jgi:hypothetical protein
MTSSSRKVVYRTLLVAAFLLLNLVVFRPSPAADVALVVCATCGVALSARERWRAFGTER